MADDEPEDNIVRLDRLREQRQSQLGELDDAALKKLRDDSQAALAALIDRFNEQYAVVNEGGKIWVFRWGFDPALNRKVLERIKVSDFRLMFENEDLAVFAENPRTKEGITTTKSVAQWWLKHKRRRQYLGGVTFNPTGQAPPDYWNLWGGFGVEPRRGDWDLLRSHIENVLCSGVSEYALYVLDWMARSVQFPNAPGEVALVFRGTEGCGKGTLGRWYVALFGQHGMQINNPVQLVGRFNEHLRDLLALFGDEAFYAGDKHHEGVLKGLITEPSLSIEGKGLRVVVVPNMLHVMLASNSEWVVPTSRDARRYAVFDVPDTKVGNFAYFTAINRQMSEGGLAAMMHDLRERDISRFEVRRIPETEELAVQKLLSLDSLGKWWLAVLERGFVLRSRHGVAYFGQWHEVVSTELLRRSYQQWCADNRQTHPQSREQLGIRMTEMYRPTRPRKQSVIGEIEVRPPMAGDASLVVKADHVPGYEVGSLDEARARFASTQKVVGNWGQKYDE
jgi:hypothetical protein